MGAPAQNPGAEVGQIRRLYACMAPHSFVASRRELLEADFSRDRIANWIRTGRLIKLLRGVYSYGRDVDTRSAVWRAGLVAAGPGSALTGRSACEAWGFVGTGSQIPFFVTVAIARGETRELAGRSPALQRTTFRFVRRRLDPDDFQIKDGLAVVVPIVALMDFASVASEREVRFAFLEACRLKIVSRREVDELFKRIAGRRGAHKVRPLLSLWVPELGRIRSVFEGLFLLAWTEAGHPMPRVNEKLFGFEVDLYWSEYRLVLELDGGGFHNNPARQAIDMAKQRKLEAHDLKVLRISYSEFNKNAAAAMERVLLAMGMR